MKAPSCVTAPLGAVLYAPETSQDPVQSTWLRDAIAPRELESYSALCTVVLHRAAGQPEIWCIAKV